MRWLQQRPAIELKMERYLTGRPESWSKFQTKERAFQTKMERELQPSHNNENNSNSDKTKDYPVVFKNSNPINMNFNPYFIQLALSTEVLGFFTTIHCLQPIKQPLLSFPFISPHFLPEKFGELTTHPKWTNVMHGVDEVLNLVLINGQNKKEAS